MRVIACVNYHCLITSDLFFILKLLDSNAVYYIVFYYWLLKINFIFIVVMVYIFDCEGIGAVLSLGEINIQYLCTVEAYR